MKEHVTQNVKKKIKCIQFGILPPEEIHQMSEFEVVNKDLYTIENRQPATSGVLDRRLGISDKKESCTTCGLKLADCIGHYAYIQLHLPVFHIGFFKTIQQTLQNICKVCSSVLLEEKERRKFLAFMRRPNLENLQKMRKVKEITKECKKCSYCPYCGALSGFVKKIGALKLVHEKFRTKKSQDEKEKFLKGFEKACAFDSQLKTHIGKAQEDLNPLKVYKLFSKISPEDCELLGFDPINGRPENFIWTSIPVPPVCIRPSVVQEGGSNEDDLTIKLSEIYFTNSLIKTCIDNGGNANQLMEQWEFLQLSVAMYINSSIPGINMMTHNVKPIRAFCQRLKGKQGRFRGNLSGKRVDFSGRTVISPDPNLRIDQIAVPELVAKVLTYPEVVTDFNIKKLQACIMNGPDIHPGANFLTGANGFKRFLKYGDRNAIAQNLQVGDIVERHINDNDVVLFNRQPSLHRLSIMAHLVKVRPWRTFRFNECVCNPYNADFDGDEMNLHVPQTQEARIEAYELMGVKNNLVTPRNGEPLIAAIQDFITASYLITKKDRFYDRSQFTQICSYMSDATLKVDLPPPTIIKPVALWTGKQIFNVLMRPNRNKENKESQLLINFESKCRSYIKSAGIPELCPNDGYLIVRNSEIMSGVMDKATVGDGNKNSLFYVVLRDYGPIQAAECMNRLSKLCARWLGNQGFSLGISDVMPTKELNRRKADAVAKANRKCENFIEQHKNHTLELQAGSNEDQTLETSISGTLSKVREEMGQVCVEELNKYNAPLTMALCGSKGSKINVCQMVACVGQQIISGERIPDGFEDRSLPHFLKKSKIPEAKGFVENSFYTGLSPTEFFFHAISGREGLVDTAVKTAETGYMQRRLIKALEDLATQYDLTVRNSEGGLVQFKYGADGLDPMVMEGDGTPVEFTRNLEHVQQSNPLDLVPTDPKKKPDVILLPYQIINLTKSFLNQGIFKNSCSPEFSTEVLKHLKEKVADKIAALRLNLGLKADGYSKNFRDDLNDADTVNKLAMVNQRFFITVKQLEKFLKVCMKKYIKATIEPGTAVGAIGAQSIGEPGTQMTLKTFHFAGVASMNITMGVPRIKEIINASKEINTPIIEAELVNGKSEISARIVKGRVEKTSLGDIAEFIEEVYEEGFCYINIKIALDTIAKLHLELTIHDIQRAIQSERKLKKFLGPLIVDSNNKIQVHPKTSSETSTFYDLQFLKRNLLKINVNGFKDINRAVISDVSKDKDDKQYKLFVEGCGLRNVMTTRGIIGHKTKSNHITEVESVLGIEAARFTIINEIQTTMQSHGMTIDPRHVMLLGDVMTFKGEVLGITRFGIAKMKDSVLMLASFENTTDHLFDAALYAKRDPAQGVSECIIMGITMPIGTGLFKLLQQQPTPPNPPRKLLFDLEEYHPSLKKLVENQELREEERQAIQAERDAGQYSGYD